jgi:hypothetical protein
MTALTGAERISVERARQLLPREDGGEGWNAAHDRGQTDALARAAAAYALPAHQRLFEYASGAWKIKLDLRHHIWPWKAMWWKPTPKDRIRELEKAGALIAAAIDSLLQEEG